MTHTGDSCTTLVPLFAGLTREEQDEVASYAHPIRRGRGEQIHRPNDPVSHLLVVHQGRVKISHIAPSGQEQLIRVLEPGDFIGESAFVTGARPDHFATALTPVELCSFDHADLGALVRTYPDIAIRMLQAVTQRLDDTERLLTDVTTSDVEARLAKYLLDLPAEHSGGQVAVTLPLPKKDVAALLGTIPETLSRRLGAFVDAGLITVRGSRVVLTDVDGLVERSERH